MKHVNENSAVTAFQTRNHMRNLPFFGSSAGDFNFVMGRSSFTPGISIKLLPLSDMSKKGADAGISEFDHNINHINHYFKVGDRIRGILVNSQLNTDNGKTVVGKLNKIDIDRRNHTIKIFISDPETFETQEVYVDTMERMYESINSALTFSQFINS